MDKCMHCDKPATLNLTIGGEELPLCDEHWKAAQDRAMGLSKDRPKSVRFKKIKARKDGKLRLEYEIQNKESWDEFTMNCVDEAVPSYAAAMAALAQDVIEMCELPESYLNRIVVTGVSFSYGGEAEVMGAVITAQMRLKQSNQPLNLNTPHKTETFYGETGDESQLLDEMCVQRLATLTAEAEDYVGGVRLQVDMFQPA